MPDRARVRVGSGSVQCRDDALAGVGEVGKPSFSNLTGELGLERRENTESVQQRALTFAGPANSLGAPILGIVDALDDAFALEVIDERADRLLRDTELVGDLREANAVDADVREELRVSDAERPPRRSNVRDRTLVDEPRRAEEQLECRAGQSHTDSVKVSP